MMGSLKDELLAIYREHGELTPALVVAEATNPDHALHSRFEWNDGEAARKWREEQAGQLIRSVRITFMAADGPADLRAFVAVREPQSSSVYRPTEEVVADPFARELLLREMERDWKVFKRRYSHMVEFVELVRRDLAV